MGQSSKMTELHERKMKLMKRMQWISNSFDEFCLSDNN
jgi:hypothetical protein